MKRSFVLTLISFLAIFLVVLAIQVHSLTRISHTIEQTGDFSAMNGLKLTYTLDTNGASWSSHVTWTDAGPQAARIRQEPNAVKHPDEPSYPSDILASIDYDLLAPQQPYLVIITPHETLCSSHAQFAQMTIINDQLYSREHPKGINSDALKQRLQALLPKRDTDDISVQYQNHSVSTSDATYFTYVTDPPSTAQDNGTYGLFVLPHRLLKSDWTQEEVQALRLWKTLDPRWTIESLLVNTSQDALVLITRKDDQIKVLNLDLVTSETRAEYLFELSNLAKNILTVSSYQDYLFLGQSAGEDLILRNDGTHFTLVETIQTDQLYGDKIILEREGHTIIASWRQVFTFDAPPVPELSLNVEVFEQGSVIYSARIKPDFSIEVAPYTTSISLTD